MSEPQRLPLFVFGTLRQGQVNHHYLAEHYARMVPAILPGYRRLHPLMITPGDSSEVDGELYYLIHETYDRTLAGCDELEEIPPGQLVGHEYQRKQVEVLTTYGPVIAWAYVQPED